MIRQSGNQRESPGAWQGFASHDSDRKHHAGERDVAKRGPGIFLELEMIASLTWRWAWGFRGFDRELGQALAVR